MPTLIRAPLACCDHLVMSALGWGACLSLYGGVVVRRWCLPAFLDGAREWEKVMGMGRG